MYNNYEYIRVEENIEEISKIKIKTNKLYRKIEDIEIDIIEPNILTYYYDKNMENIKLENIYSGVKILITSKELMIKKYKEIPEYIENIIVDGKIYYNNGNKLEYIDFMSVSELDEIIDNYIYNNRCNEVNSRGQIILERAIISFHKRTNEIIDKTSEENINKYLFDTLLIYISDWRNIENMKKIIKRLYNETINRTKNNYSLLFMAVRNSISKELIEYLVEKSDDKILNLVDYEAYYGNDILECLIENNMDDLVIKNFDRFEDKLFDKKTLTLIYSKKFKNIAKKIKDKNIKFDYLNINHYILDWYKTI